MLYRVYRLTINLAAEIYHKIYDTVRFALAPGSTFSYRICHNASHTSFPVIRLKSYMIFNIGNL